MKTYLIPEELLKKVISAIVLYKEDSEELNNIGKIPNCWLDDLGLLKTELEELKELTEKKTYRPCKTIREFYNLIFNINSKVDDTEFYFNELLGADIHFRDKETGTEYFTTISTITKDKNGCVRVFLPLKGYHSFKDFFEEYEIEVEGEFKPFGVTDET